jgi:hypothetical protein
VLVVATAGIALAWRKSKIRVSPPLRSLGAAAGVLLTFNLVCLGLALFRAESLGQVRALFAELPVDWHVSVFWELTHVGPAPPDAVAIDLGILAFSIVLLEAVQWWLAHRASVRVPPVVRFVAWPLLCVWVVLAAVQSHAPFIYFAF